jgi:hypothetical protein
MRRCGALSMIRATGPWKRGAWKRGSVRGEANIVAHGSQLLTAHGLLLSICNHVVEGPPTDSTHSSSASANTSSASGLGTPLHAMHALVPFPPMSAATALGRATSQTAIVRAIQGRESGQAMSLKELARLPVMPHPAPVRAASVWFLALARLCRLLHALP